MKFQFLTGDINYREYGGKWISPKLNNGDFDYWIVLEAINMHDATGEEDQPKYNLSLSSVSPSEAGEDNLRRALDCIGIAQDDITEEMKVEALHTYGISALLWNESGDNFNRLMTEAKRQAICAEGLFGFYMDGPKNRIGNTGWDFIKGDIGFKEV